MKTFEEYYKEECLNRKSDIYQHLPTLSELSAKCSSVVEIGVRKVVSSWAFLNGLILSPKQLPKKITCVDIKTPEEYLAGERIEDFSRICSENGIIFEFKKESSLEMSPVETDFLFIDTVHNYEFLSKELKRHGPYSRKYIAMHDTEICKTIGHDNGGGMWKAIEEFLDKYPEWKIKYHFTNNNGLTVLCRHGQD